MKNRPEISEENLDTLLREYFLQDNARDLTGMETNFIFNQEYNVSIDVNKEKQLLRRLNRGGFGRYFPHILVIVLLLSVLAALYFSGEKEDTSVQAEKPVKPLSEKNNNHAYVYPPGATLFPENTGEIIPVSARAQNDPVQPGNFSDSAFPSQQDSFRRENAVAATPAQSNLPGINIPLLTPEEKEWTVKMKSRMLEHVLNPDKKLYTQVKEGTVQYIGKALPVNAFTIRNIAVTNLEYKIFLYDLLSQNKTEEYKKAAVKTGAWNDYGCGTLAGDYFQDKKYNDFPVVNIPVEGALLYCRWLEGELNDFIKKKDPAAKELKIRLPFDAEWIYAARMGYARTPDCAGYNTIFDFRENYVDDSFVKRLALIIRRDKNKNTAMNRLFEINRYGMKEEEMLKLFARGVEEISPLPSDTIIPSRMEAYGKAGHVSEIIVEKKSGRILIMGCCWKSRDEYLAMLKEFNSRTASPFVGFRVVVVHPGAAEYKNPFW